MSKFVDEILEDIKTNQNSWSKNNRAEHGRGIKKDNIIIAFYGNSPLLSIIDVYIDNQRMPLTYMDRWDLEKAVGWWYRNIDLERAMV